MSGGAFESRRQHTVFYRSELHRLANCVGGVKLGVAVPPQAVKMRSKSTPHFITVIYHGLVTFFPLEAYGGQECHRNL